MKVKELIEKLQLVDPDAEVGVRDAQRIEGPRGEVSVEYTITPVNFLRVAYNEYDRRFLVFEADCYSHSDLEDAIARIETLEHQLDREREEAGK